MRVKPNHFGKAMIGNIWDVLRGVELGISLHDPLLPGHLVEILVVKDSHHPAAVGPLTPVFGDCDEFGHVAHLHGAVTNEADHGSIWMREFCCDSVGNRRAHRCKPAGKRRHHAAPHFQIARIPVGARSRVARHNGVVGQS